MNLDKILETLKVDALDESAQQEITDNLKSIVEAKAEIMAEEKLQSQLDEKIKEVTESTIADLEEKFEAYKEDIVDKFSDFLDEVLDEELEIPENIIEYARKGELYTDLIEQFKIRLAIDEGVLDEEARKLMQEAKDELDAKDEEINTLMTDGIEVKADAKEMATKLYIYEKCEGMTTSDRKKMVGLLEGLNTVEKIDEKFDFLKSILTESEDEDEEDDEEDEDEDEDEDENKKDKKKGKKVNETKDDINLTEKKKETSSNPFVHHIQEWAKN